MATTLTQGDMPELGHGHYLDSGRHA